MDNDNEFIHEDDNNNAPQPSNPQVVAPSRGFYWLERSLSEIVVPHFGKWFIAGLIYSVVVTLASLVSPALSMIVGILNPIFFAGGYLGAHKVYNNTGDIQPGQFFQGFAHSKKVQLLLYSLALIVIVVIAFLIIGSFIGIDALQSIDLAALEAGNQVAAEAVAEMFLSVIGWILLFGFIITLTNWFAPNLILFEDNNAINSMGNSLITGLKNILPFLVLGLVLIGCAIALFLIAFVVMLIVGAILPPNIGQIVMQTLINAAVIPIMIGVGYISYREVFLGDIKKSDNSL